ncbi:hypothetical protein C8R42DRAFT_777560 [Lentinula raphanica]|nr:hypothetical protein C8R42DRAFT_777560 [Lentinula raphanica]
MVGPLQSGGMKGPNHNGGMEGLTKGKTGMEGPKRENQCIHNWARSTQNSANDAWNHVPKNKPTSSSVLSIVCQNEIFTARLGRPGLPPPPGLSTSSRDEFEPEPSPNCCLEPVGPRKGGGRLGVCANASTTQGNEGSAVDAGVPPVEPCRFEKVCVHAYISAAVEFPSLG